VDIRIEILRVLVGGFVQGRCIQSLSVTGVGLGFGGEGDEEREVSLCEIRLEIQGGDRFAGVGIGPGEVVEERFVAAVSSSPAAYGEVPNDVHSGGTETKTPEADGVVRFRPWVWVVTIELLKWTEGNDLGRAVGVVEDIPADDGNECAGVAGAIVEEVEFARVLADGDAGDLLGIESIGSRGGLAQPESTTAPRMSKGMLGAGGWEFGNPADGVLNLKTPRGSSA